MTRPASGILFNGGVPLAPEVDISFAGAGGHISLEAAHGGLLRVTPRNAHGTPTKVVERRIYVPPALLGELGWSKGQVVSVARPERDIIEVAPIDPRQHPDFVAPEIAADGLPLPPHYLVQAFTGVVDRTIAMRLGEKTARYVADCAASYGRPLEEGSCFLDFGCGSGRVLRTIPRLTGATVIGTDLHHDAMEWCRRHLPGTYLDGYLRPPLTLPDDSVDAMLALSVLTHLDEDLCVEWLTEWKRILKPGAIAVVSFNGEGLLESRFKGTHPLYDDIIRGLAENEGSHYVSNAAWEGIFPDAYQTAFYTYEHVRKVWGSVMNVAEIRPSSDEFSNRQDVVILQA